MTSDPQRCYVVGVTQCLVSARCQDGEGVRQVRVAGGMVRTGNEAVVTVGVVGGVMVVVVVVVVSGLKVVEGGLVVVMHGEVGDVLNCVGVEGGGVSADVGVGALVLVGGVVVVSRGVVVVSSDVDILLTESWVTGRPFLRTMILGVMDESSSPADVFCLLVCVALFLVGVDCFIASCVVDVENCVVVLSSCIVEEP